MESLPFAAVENLMKSAGSVRTSSAAVIALSRVLVSHAAVVSARAVTLARHAGRKTVQEEDIVLAAQVQ